MKRRTPLRIEVDPCTWRIDMCVLCFVDKRIASQLTNSAVIKRNYHRLLRPRWTQWMVSRL